MTQAMLGDHTLALTFLAAAVGFLTGYIQPILGLVLVLMGIIWYGIQITKEIIAWRKERQHDIDEE